MALTVDLETGRRAFAESVTSFVRAVDAFSEWDLLDVSRCHGWTRLDVVVHVVAGWEEMLGGFVSPVDGPPTVDAATYWPAFDEERTLVRLAEAPSALRNRACWNRVFRRDFWDSAGISFPDASRSNDIEPMVHALTTARFDVVTETVYVYRDRPGPGSMTATSPWPTM